MNEEQEQQPEQEPEQEEKPHHVVLNDRKTPQAGNPTVWLVLLAIPLVLSLLVAVVRDYEPQRAERPVPLQVEPLEYKCNFSPWVGLKMQQKMLDILKGASGNERPSRIIPPGAAVTKDYKPARVNFDLDEADKITRIWCG